MNFYTSDVVYPEKCESECSPDKPSECSYYCDFDIASTQVCTTYYIFVNWYHILILPLHKSKFDKGFLHYRMILELKNGTVPDPAGFKLLHGVFGKLWSGQLKPLQAKKRDNQPSTSQKMDSVTCKATRMIFKESTITNTTLIRYSDLKMWSKKTLQKI